MLNFIKYGCYIKKKYVSKPHICNFAVIYRHLKMKQNKLSILFFSFWNNNILRLGIKVYLIYKRYFKTRLKCYYTRGNKHQFNIVIPIQSARSVQQLPTFNFDNAFLQTAYNRFKLNHQLFFCVDNNIIVGYGWKATGLRKFYAWEIAHNVIFNQAVDVMYDFFVDEKYRRKGIYKSMLHYIINDATKNSILFIYAETANYPSNKAIEDCGFQYIDTVNNLSNKIHI